jgi:hypothetical protein
VAAPGGPDEETWKRMSPRARRLYWIFIASIFALIGYGWIRVWVS